MEGPLPSLQPMQAGRRPHQEGSGQVDVTFPASHPTQGQVATPPHSVTLGQPTVDAFNTQPLQAGEVGEGRAEEEEERNEEAEAEAEAEERDVSRGREAAAEDEEEEDEGKGTGRWPHAEGSGQEGVERPSYAPHHTAHHHTTPQHNTRMERLSASGGDALSQRRGGVGQSIVRCGRPH